MAEDQHQSRQDCHRLESSKSESFSPRFDLNASSFPCIEMVITAYTHLSRSCVSSLMRYLSSCDVMITSRKGVTFLPISSYRKTMFLPVFAALILVHTISSVRGQCVQSACSAYQPGSTCCFNVGCCPASSNVCCPNDPSNCCSTQFPVCCGSGKGCCPQVYPVCCPTHCCASGSYCCGQKCCRRTTLSGRFVELDDRMGNKSNHETLTMVVYGK